MTDHTIVLHDHNKSRADLVAKAIARLQKEKLDTETWLANEESWTSQDDIDHARYYLRIVDCHLAEFEEHRVDTLFQIGTGIEGCIHCRDTDLDGAKEPSSYPCDFVTTKVNRLLGKELR